MRRKLIVLLTVCFVLAACCIPAFAADLDYNDYVANVDSDGSKDTISVSIPAGTFTQVQWRLYNANLSGIGSITGVSASFSLSANTNYGIGCAPFSADYLDLRDIPNGTIITFLFDVFTDGSYTPPTQGKLIFDYYAADHTIISSSQTEWEDITTSYKLSATLNKPDGATYARVTSLQRYYVPSSTASISFRLEAVRFTFSIASLTRLQQETGRTNELLEEIKNGYEPDPTAPSVNDDVNDMHQQEDDIIDSMEPDRIYDDLDDVTLTIFDQLLLYANAFTLITVLFNSFLSIPQLGLLTYISLALGLLAALLGIGINVIKSKGDSA